MFNMEIIKQNSRRVYDLMKQMYRYTFKELEQATSLDSTEFMFGSHRTATGKEDWSMEKMRPGFIMHVHEQ